MRVRAGVAPRVESGDRAASKGKSAGGCSSFKRRVEREERCAAPHVFFQRLPLLHRHSLRVGAASPCVDDSALPQRAVGLSPPRLARNSDRPWCVCTCAQVGWAPGMG
jgi:hypothetical protein